MNPEWKRNRKYSSKMFGINHKSLLCELPHFPVTENIIQDPVHCLLEGVVGQEIALFLHMRIYDLGLVSLKWVNEKLKNFEYHTTDAGNKSNEIEKVHVTMPKMFLKQKASVILTLVYFLPIVVGELIEEIDPYYCNFIACMKIATAAFSPYADKTEAGELEQLMYSYCKNFVWLHPGISFKPKMHYMLHLPKQILKFGPLCYQNTMRFESKHSWFKDFRWKNFINLPYSLSEKHQLNLAHNMTNVEGHSSRRFVYKGDLIKQGKSIGIRELDADVVVTLPHELCLERLFYRSDHVEIDGLEYKKGDGILIEEDEISGPLFACIREVLCCDAGKFLVLDYDGH